MSEIKTEEDGKALTPRGDVIDANYWLKILPEVNKCGDRFAELYIEYRDIPATNTQKLEECARRFNTLMLFFGEVPFAVCITVWADNSTKTASVFSANIFTFLEEMPTPLQITVERLRYQNARLQKKAGEITGLFKMKSIAERQQEIKNEQSSQRSQE